jgi:uncharacterized protein DUF11
VIYTIVVSDPTRTAARKVTVCDTVPSGLLYVSSNPKATLNDGRECWFIPVLGAHRSKAFQLTATVLRSHNGPKTNTATATAPGLKTVRAKATISTLTPPQAPCVLGFARRAATAHANGALGATTGDDPTVEHPDC